MTVHHVQEKPSSVSLYLKLSGVVLNISMMYYNNKKVFLLVCLPVAYVTYLATDLFMLTILNVDFSAVGKLHSPLF